MKRQDRKKYESGFFHGFASSELKHCCLKVSSDCRPIVINTKIQSEHLQRESAPQKLPHHLNGTLWDGAGGETVEFYTGEMKPCPSRKQDTLKSQQAKLQYSVTVLQDTFPDLIDFTKAKGPTLTKAAELPPLTMREDQTALIFPLTLLTTC